MFKKYSNFVIITIITINASMATAELKNQKIHLCEGDSEYPPYMYYERINGVKTNKVVGYSVDILSELLIKEQGAELIFHFPPWKRCLKYVHLGKYDIAPNSVFTEKRNIAYLMTIPYYHVTPSYFFIKERYSNGPNIKKPEDYNNYSVCGMQGYDYNKYNIDQSLIDKNSSDFNQLFEKLRRHRCDIVLARIEPILGFKSIGLDLLKKDISYNESPMSEISSFHMLISRKLSNAQELKLTLDEGINKMEKTKFLDKTLHKHLK